MAGVWRWYVALFVHGLKPAVNNISSLWDYSPSLLERGIGGEALCRPFWIFYPIRGFLKRTRMRRGFSQIKFWYLFHHHQNQNPRTSALSALSAFNSIKSRRSKIKNRESWKSIAPLYTHYFVFRKYILFVCSRLDQIFRLKRQQVY